MGKMISAVVLAGGLGTRLRSVVSDVPKVLAPVAGKPFLCYLFEQLAEAGIDETVICTGYMADEIRQRLGELSENVKLDYSHEESPLGTAGAIRNAFEKIHGDTVLIMNGDSFCDLDLKRFIEWHSAKGARASLALREMSDTARYGRVSVSMDGRVEAFLEKGKGGPGWINAGIYLIDRSLIEGIPAARKVSIEEEVFPGWVHEGALFGYQASVKRFIDIGTPESFAEAQLVMRKE